ncbi:MAG TPA: hypothetical protein VK181_06405 [Rhizobium sp.]|nr:hypothetical protein [Rhizobium sp.]
MERAKTSDELYLDLRRRMPGWAFYGLTRTRIPAASPLYNEGALFDGGQLYEEPTVESNETVAKDPIFGSLCALFADFYVWHAWLVRQAYLGFAEGEWLDLHAADRGTQRKTQENDEALRRRLRTIPDRVTESAIKAAVDEVLCIGESQVFTLRLEEAFDEADFFDGGKRLAGNLIPRPLGDDTPIDRAFFDVSFFDQSAWSDGSLFGPIPILDASAWLVAVVLVVPQEWGPFTFWDRDAYFDVSFFGDVNPDLACYKAIREAAEETKAAGVKVEIWIERAE